MIVYNTWIHKFFNKKASTIILNVRLIIQTYYFKFIHLWYIKFLLRRIKCKCDEITSGASLEGNSSGWCSIHLSAKTSQKQGPLKISKSIIFLAKLWWWNDYLKHNYDHIHQNSIGLSLLNKDMTQFQYWCVRLFRQIFQFSKSIRKFCLSQIMRFSWTRILCHLVEVKSRQFSLHFFDLKEWSVTMSNHFWFYVVNINQ